LSTINNSLSYTKNFTIADGSSALLEYAASNGIDTLVRASSLLESGQVKHKSDKISVSWVGICLFPTVNTNPTHNFTFNLCTD
jgi:hypothetical protein